MGQYSDAATSFEFIMSEKGDLRSGLHLILCYYALGNVEKIRRAFQLLLEVPIEYNDEDRIVGQNVRGISSFLIILNLQKLFQG